MVLLFEILDNDSDTLIAKGRYRSFDEAVISLERYGKKGDIIKGKWEVATKTEKGIEFSDNMREAISKARRKA